MKNSDVNFTMGLNWTHFSNESWVHELDHVPKKSKFNSRLFIKIALFIISIPILMNKPMQNGFPVHCLYSSMLSSFQICAEIKKIGQKYTKG